MFPRLKQNRLRRALREHGEDLGHGEDILDAVCSYATAENVAALKSKLPPELVAKAPKGLFDDSGERPILSAIAEWLSAIGEWLRSPDGQAAIAALFKAILAALLAMGTVAVLVG